MKFLPSRRTITLWLGRTLATAAVFGLVVAAWSLRNEYPRAWATWWDGGETGALPLGWLSVLWWGRVGKLLQFIAGLVVVLDLIGPEALRAFGQRAADRWRRTREFFRFRRLTRMWQLNNRILDSLYEERSSEDAGVWGPTGPVFFYRLSETVPDPLVDLPEEISEETMTAFQHLLWERLAPHRYRSRRHIRKIASPVIFDFLYEQMPAGKRVTAEALNKWTRWNERLVMLPWILAAGIGFLVILVVGHFFSLVGMSPQLAGFISAGLLLVILTMSFPMLEYVPLLLLSAALVPVVVLAQLTAMALNRQHPGHPIRWAALFVFVIGFHFDLLAS